MMHKVEKRGELRVPYSANAGSPLRFYALTCHRSLFLRRLPSPYPPEMYVALSMKDVVVIIVGHVRTRFGRHGLLVLATTNRVFSDAALDLLWEQVESFTLAQQMSASLWTVRIDKTGVGENRELVRLERRLCDRTWADNDAICRCW
jgi:hypothetical protein